MPITVEQSRKLISEFCRIYPAAYQLKYKVRATQEEAFGKAATVEEKGKILGGYFPAKRLVAFAASNALNTQDFTKAIRHEILGHFGLNTLRPSEKKALIDIISKTRDQPSFSKIWSSIDTRYPELSELFKAEEIACLTCESIKPSWTINGLKAVIKRSRPMEKRDLSAIMIAVASSLKSRTRVQQTFPATDQDQWNREENPDFKL